MPEATEDKWLKWQSKHASKPNSWREAVALRLSETDWAMLLVPGIVLISSAMILGSLMGLGIL